MRIRRRSLAVVVFGLLLVAAQPKADSDAQVGNQQITQSNAAPIGEAPILTAHTADVDSPDKGCLDAIDNRASDLCAQWKAADAAASAAYWSWWQVLIGGLGIIAGFGTLWAAVKAALYARDAANETRRAADYAGEMHAITVGSNKAYVTVTHVEQRATEIDGCPVLKFCTRYSNFGLTPAVDVQMWEFGLCLLKEEPTERICDMSWDQPSATDRLLAPNQIRETQGYPITGDDLNRFLNKQVRLFLPVYITYKNIFEPNRLHTVISEVEVEVMFYPSAPTEPIFRYRNHRYETF